MHAGRPKFTQETGASLIAVLVAVGIAGVAVMAAATLSSNSFKALRHAELRADLMDIRTHIATRIDCGNSARNYVAPTNPHGRRYVQIYDNAPSATPLPPLIKIPNGSDYTRLGPFALYAVIGAGNKIVIYYAALRADGSLVKDQLLEKSNATEYAAGWKNLYAGYGSVPSAYTGDRVVCGL